MDPNEPQPGDLELLRATARRERAAFETLLDRYERPLLRFARSQTGDRESAEDATQETFLAVWRHASSFRGNTDAEGRSWLYAIARHATRRMNRRRSGEPERFDSWEDLGNGAGFGLTDLDFERRLADRDGVRRAFARLAAEDREVLLLRDIEGFHGDEAATLLEIGLPALKSRLHRARLRLVAELRGTGGVR